MVAFDYLSGTILIGSGIAGLVRGATKEVAGVVTLVGSALISVWALRFSEPVALHYVHLRWLADAAAVIAVFAGVFLVGRMIASALAQTVRETPLSGLDRLLGAGVGLVRALVILGVFTLIVCAATPKGAPGWMAQAKTYPLARASADALRTFAPEGLRFAERVAASPGPAPDSDTTDTDAARSPEDRR